MSASEIASIITSIQGTDDFANYNRWIILCATRADAGKMWRKVLDTLYTNENFDKSQKTAAAQAYLDKLADKWQATRFEKEPHLPARKLVELDQYDIAWEQITEKRCICETYDKMDKRDVQAIGNVIAHVLLYSPESLFNQVIDTVHQRIKHHSFKHPTLTRYECSPAFIRSLFLENDCKYDKEEGTYIASNQIVFNATLATLHHAISTATTHLDSAFRSRIGLIFSKLHAFYADPWDNMTRNTSEYKPKFNLLKRSPSATVEYTDRHQEHSYYTLPINRRLTSKAVQQTYSFVGYHWSYTFVRLINGARHDDNKLYLCRILFLHYSSCDFNLTGFLCAMAQELERHKAAISTSQFILEFYLANIKKILTSTAAAALLQHGAKDFNATQAEVNQFITCVIACIEPTEDRSVLTSPEILSQPKIVKAYSTLKDKTLIGQTDLSLLTRLLEEKLYLSFCLNVECQPFELSATEMATILSALSTDSSISQDHLNTYVCILASKLPKITIELVPFQQLLPSSKETNKRYLKTLLTVCTTTANLPSKEAILNWFINLGVDDILLEHITDSTLSINLEQFQTILMRLHKEGKLNDEAIGLLTDKLVTLPADSYFNSEFIQLEACVMALCKNTLASDKIPHTAIIIPLLQYFYFSTLLNVAISNPRYIATIVEKIFPQDLSSTNAGHYRDLLAYCQSRQTIVPMKDSSAYTDIRQRLVLTQLKFMINVDPVLNASANFFSVINECDSLEKHVTNVIDTLKIAKEQSFLGEFTKSLKLYKAATNIFQLCHEELNPKKKLLSRKLKATSKRFALICKLLGMNDRAADGKSKAELAEQFSLVQETLTLVQEHNTLATPINTPAIDAIPSAPPQPTAPSTPSLPVKPESEVTEELPEKKPACAGAGAGTEPSHDDLEPQSPTEEIRRDAVDISDFSAEAALLREVEALKEQLAQTKLSLSVFKADNTALQQRFEGVAAERDVARVKLERAEQTIAKQAEIITRVKPMIMCGFNMKGLLEDHEASMAEAIEPSAPPM